MDVGLLLGRLAYCGGRLHHTTISRYVRDLVALCSVASPLGTQLDALKNGIPFSPNHTNKLESLMIRLIDRYGIGYLPTREDIRVLLVYYHASGKRIEILGNGGSVIDQWASDCDHRQAAQMLGIKGRNRAYMARKQLLTVQRKLTNSYGVN